MSDPELFVLVVECETDGTVPYPAGVAADALRERGMFEPRDGVRPVRLHVAIKDTATQVLAAVWKLAHEAVEGGRAMSTEPEPIELVRQLRTALGLPDVALPATPQQVWEDALAHVRGLAEGRCHICMLKDAPERGEAP
jgi:hypothetical protein